MRFSARTDLTLVFVIGVFAAVSARSHAAGLHTNGELMALLLGLLIAGFLGTIWYLTATLSGGAVHVQTETQSGHRLKRRCGRQNTCSRGLADTGKSHNGSR